MTRSAVDWVSLCAGERVAVSSLSGNRYEGVLLGAGPSGVFLRMAGRGVVRLGLDRIDAETLEARGRVAPLETDDEVILQPSGGVELRGRVEEANEERAVVSVPGRGPLAVAYDEVEAGSAFPLFRASSLRPGDAFLARSRSGRDYRGTVASVSARYLVVQLQPTSQQVRLRVAELDLRSVEVLIPLRLSD